MSNIVSPYVMGDLESSCGWYSCINALRVCLRRTPQSDGFYHDLVRHLVRDVDPRLAKYLLEGFNIVDVVEILQATAVFVETRLGLTLTFWRPFVGTSPLSQPEYFREIDGFITRRQHAGILAFGTNYHRYHWTVPVRITPHTIRVADSCNDKVVRTRGLRIAKPGAQCGLSYWMPQATFILAVGTAPGGKKPCS